MDQGSSTNRIIWTAIAAVGAIVSVSAIIGPFQIVWTSFLPSIGTFCMLSIGSWFYRTVRSDQRIAVTLNSTSQILAFVAVTVPLSYIAASTSLPLWDEILATWDRHLGLDWLQLRR